MSRLEWAGLVLLGALYSWLAIAALACGETHLRPSHKVASIPPTEYGQGPWVTDTEEPTIDPSVDVPADGGADDEDTATDGGSEDDGNDNWKWVPCKSASEHGRGHAWGRCREHKNEDHLQGD